MTFSGDLWNGFDFVYNHFNERRKGLKQLLFMMSENFNCEYELAKGLKRISDYNYSITNEGTLASGLLVFKQDLIKQYSHTMEYINNMKDGLIDPLRNFLESQVTNGRKFHIEIKELEREFKYVCDNLDKSKLRYHSYAKVAEESKLYSEVAKSNPNLSNDQKSKFANKVQLSLKEAKDAERVYIDNITTANNFRDTYTDGAKKILDEFQMMEEKYIDFSKEFLRKYFEYQFIFWKNLSNDYERKIKLIETVNTQADIKDFIEKNATNLPPPFKFEFIPYTSDVQTKFFEQKPYPIEIINNVKSFIAKTFCSEIPEAELDVQETKNNSEIQGIINLAWEGKLSEEDKKTFMRYIKEKKYRRYFLTCLNKFRISGLFTIEEKSFNFLGELLGRILDETAKERDYESAKFCMILSQTFYKISADPNKVRIFLQEAIESHDIWKQIDFWEGIIKYSVNEEAHNQRAAHTYINESVDDKQMRIQSIAFGQLLSFSFNMLSFLIPKEKVKETINNFCKIYKIQEDMSGQILKSVDEYTDTMNQQVKMDIIDDNLSNISEEINDNNSVYDEKLLKNFMDNQTSQIASANSISNLIQTESNFFNSSDMNTLSHQSSSNTFQTMNSGSINYNN